MDKKFSLLFWFAGTLVMIVVMAKTGAPLKTSATPKGILDLEFAYNTTKASAVINAWTGVGAVDNIFAAKINTWLDFVFLFFYSFFLNNICKLLAESFRGFLFIAGRFIAKGAFAAGITDLLENTGMLITLQGHLSEICRLLTFIFSIIKWIIALTAVLYILIGGLLLFYQKIKRIV